MFSNLQYAVDGKVLLASKSFSIQQGDKILITGLNGCGKTTFLKILDKMYEIQDGMVYFNGVDYHAMTEEEVRSRPVNVFTPQTPEIISVQSKYSKTENFSLSRITPAKTVTTVIIFEN